jgi:hypothetical protein
MGWFYVLVGVLGAAVAVGELVSRYRDAPMKALTTIPAFVYIAINASASLGALALIRAFDWKFGVTGTSSDPAVRWTQTLVAGFGALAFFRSSLFIIHVGDKDIGMGPSAFLQSVLDAADRGVDRVRANARSRLVAKVMQGVSFEKAYLSLPAYSLALMQNVPADVQVEIGQQVDKLRTSNMSDGTKVLNLGLLLMNEVGGTVLASAVAGLHDEIVEASSPPGPPPAGSPSSTPPEPAAVPESDPSTEPEPAVTAALTEPAAEARPEQPTPGSEPPLGPDVQDVPQTDDERR